MRRTRGFSALVAVLLTAGIALAGCGGGESDDGSTESGSQHSQEFLKGLHLDNKLHNQLPAEIKESGTLTSVMSGAFPPYTIPTQGGQKFTGAAIDLGDALGKVLGVKVKTVPVEGLSGVLSGLQSGRYDFAMGPIGDYADRRGSHDFVDYVQEFVAFLVPADNPHNIKSLDDICGLKIAVQAGGSAEDVVRTKSKDCAKNGKEPVDVKSFKDQPSST
ncbi:MAG: transporter substrate-binding domain-containing protein, partial [Nocardioidaceae bacterium]